MPKLSTVVLGVVHRVLGDEKTGVGTAREEGRDEKSRERIA